jgi:isopentenyl diphosphate isomerase/L-lactate dehydrogenase-like FMN-dependent dehydrogenase
VSPAEPSPPAGAASPAGAPPAAAPTALDGLTLDAIEARAVGRLEPGPLAYFAGGADDERTLADNRAGWDRHRLVPRVLAGVGATPPTATTLMGGEIALPVLAAPTALQRLAHPDGEAATARACRDAGTILVLSMLGTMRPWAVAAAAPGGRRWLQLYVLRDRSLTHALIDEAVEHGFEALVVTVDTPVTGFRTRELATGFTVPDGVEQPAITDATRATGTSPDRFYEDHIDPTLDWDDLAALIERSPLPVLVKGIHHPDDAEHAVAIGVAGIVVSNHGGRQLDGAPATADLLGPVAERVAGRVPVLVDGGIRRGTDVLVALALGADAILIGRPLLWGLTVGGAVGAAAVLERLRTELQRALTLCGARDVAAARGITLMPAAGPVR